MGQSDGRQFKTALEKVGGEVVGVAGAPLDTKDFSPWFGAINQSNPDVLFVAFAGTDSLRLMTQLHSFGMTKKYKLAGIDCFLLQQDLPAIAEPMEGFVQLNHFFPHNPDMDMHLYQVKGGKNRPIARIAGNDSIGEAMVGKDPVEGFTWEIKKKN